MRLCTKAVQHVQWQSLKPEGIEIQVFALQTVPELYETEKNHLQGLIRSDEGLLPAWLKDEITLNS